jgi:N,N'-diacetyllegionaminate synthase
MTVRSTGEMRSDDVDERLPELQLLGRVVGPSRPALVIAEAGVNHNGDVRRAHALVEAAAGAGADAVKFQTFRASAVASGGAATARYQVAAGEGQSQRTMLERLELPMTAWRELRDHAHERSLAFLSTAFDMESLAVLVELGVEALKIPSGELDHTAYLRAHAATGLPLLVSTGMATFDEVVRAVELLRGDVGAVGVLHCVSAYPADLAETNLTAISTMGRALAVPMGWSDHTIGNHSAIVARTLGACIFEKHLTTDRSLPGPDHTASADPEGFASYVRTIRTTEAALGDGVKRPTGAEIDLRPLARRSHFAARDLEAGDRLTEADLTTVRPVIGVPASVDLVGRRLARSVARDQPIRFDDLV